MRRYYKYLIAAVVLLLVVFSGYRYLSDDALKRDKDDEFQKGSGIAVENLKTQQEQSLYKLCKVWGFTKYYHPSVIDGTNNWDAELFRVLPDVLSAQTGEEVNEVLYRWLLQFPYEKKGQDDEAERSFDDVFTAADLSWIEDAQFLGNDLSSYLKGLLSISQSNRENAYAAFGSGFDFVSMVQFLEKDMPYAEGDDGVKLLSLFRFWNIYEYYSPNVGVCLNDWNEVLKEFIPQFVKASDYRSYVLTVARMASQTGDGHIYVRDPEEIIANYYGSYFLPCSFRNIGGKAVVAQVEEQEDGESLVPGDILEEIDGISVEERIRVLSGYSVLPQKDRFVNKLSYSLLKTKGRTAAVTVIRDGRKVALQVEAKKSRYQEKNPYATGVLEDGSVGYMDPSSLKDGDLEKWMEEFASTKGFIVDLRRYPSNTSLPFLYLLAEYLMPEATQFAQMSMNDAARPGSFYRIDNICGGGTIEALGNSEEYPLYQGKVALLMDETSMSQCETTIMGLRRCPNAAVIGSVSMGANGDVAEVLLPGGISFGISIHGVYTPEGNVTQCVGLTPDIDCKQTVQGLREGRDECIECAVDWILGGNLENF